MADAPVVHIGENSPEKIASELLQVVARLEKKSMSGSDASEIKTGWEKADRAYVLDTYAECLHAVKGYRPFPNSR